MSSTEPTPTALKTPSERVRHGRRHRRPWYKRLWRSLFPAYMNQWWRALFAMLIVLVLSILAGMFIAQNSLSSVVSLGAP